jgi:MYND finger
MVYRYVTCCRNHHRAVADQVRGTALCPACLCHVNFDDASTWFDTHQMWETPTAGTRRQGWACQSPTAGTTKLHEERGVRQLLLTCHIVCERVIKKRYLAMIKHCTNCNTCPCEKHRREIKSCGRCQMVGYCSEACQRSDWALHKQMCDQRHPSFTRCEKVTNSDSRCRAIERGLECLCQPDMTIIYQKMSCDLDGTNMIAVFIDVTKYSINCLKIAIKSIDEIRNNICQYEDDVGETTGLLGVLDTFKDEQFYRHIYVNAFSGKYSRCCILEVFKSH